MLNNIYNWYSVVEELTVHSIFYDMDENIWRSETGSIYAVREGETARMGNIKKLRNLLCFTLKSCPRAARQWQNHEKTEAFYCVSAVRGWEHSGIQEDTVFTPSCVSWRYVTGSRWKYQKRDVELYFVSRMVHLPLAGEYKCIQNEWWYYMYTQLWGRECTKKLKNHTGIHTYSNVSQRHEIGNVWKW